SHGNGSERPRARATLRRQRSRSGGSVRGGSAMKKLLLATDLSPRSDLALQRAMDLARMHGAALSAVYVVDEDLPPALAEVVKSGAERIIRERLAALPDGDKVAVTVRSGRPANEILRHAADEQAELIVLGVHRTGGLK